MTLKEQIEICYNYTKAQRINNPLLTQCQYEICNISLAEMKEMAIETKRELDLSYGSHAVLFISLAHSPKLDTNIIVRSVPLKIKPAEVITD